MRAVVFAVLFALTTCLALSHAQGFLIGGTVTEAATGTRIPNATVRYEVHGEPAQVVMTDAEGNFEFPGGELGILTIAADGFMTARRGWTPNIRGPLDIALSPRSLVSGTIASDSLAAVLADERLNCWSDIRGGLECWVSGQSRRRFLPLSGTVTFMARRTSHSISRTVDIEEGGSFATRDLPPGRVEVLVRAEGYAPLFHILTVETGVQEVQLPQLTPMLVAAGEVRDGNDNPVAEAWVTARYPDSLEGGHRLSGFVGGQPRTGREGKFVLDGLVPNVPIALKAALEGAESEEVVVTGRPGSVESDIVLRLP